MVIFHSYPAGWAVGDALDWPMLSLHMPQQDFALTDHPPALSHSLAWQIRGPNGPTINRSHSSQTKDQSK